MQELNGFNYYLSVVVAKAYRCASYDEASADDCDLSLLDGARYGRLDDDDVLDAFDA
jgi:hypothetical protein